MTTNVDPFNSSQFGQETFFISNLLRKKNFYLIHFDLINPITSNIFAGVTGLEPATPGFGDRCSTN